MNVSNVHKYVSFQIGLQLYKNFDLASPTSQKYRISSAGLFKTSAGHCHMFSTDWIPPGVSVYDNNSIIELPALNTSYTLDSVPSGAVYIITVSALSSAGPSRNNPSVQLGKFNLANNVTSLYQYFFTLCCSIATL